ncbi:MAG: PBP1A family penicillin-binding protein [Pseudohongiellaceae bacterium]
MKKVWKTLIRKLAVFAVFGFSGAIMIASAAYLYLSPQLPAAETYRHVELETPLRILTADGQLVDEIGVRRNPIDYEEIPPLMVQAVIASEDSRFYSHPGVDLRGLIRGFYGFVRGVNLGGGSTITMQLANNISFDSDNVYARKLKEIPFALRIQQELSKEEILELYLNLVYFGGGAEGISAAAQAYYDRPVSEMTLAQFAVMASVLPCPSVCNPVANPSRAKRRRDVVLDKMLAQGMIDRQTHAEAIAEPITARRYLRSIDVNAPYVVERIRQQLYSEYGEDIYREGFEVITTIDSELQSAATQSLRDGLENYYDRRHGYRGPENHLPPRGEDPNEYWLEQLSGVPVYGNQHPAIVTAVEERSATVLMQDGTEQLVGWDGLSWARPFITRDNAWPPPEEAADVVTQGDLVRVRQGSEGRWELGQVPELQGAIVSVSPENGHILAMTGGYDFRYSQVNRATSARQPGSGFKPFLYGAALANGYTPADTINDAPFSRNGYRPQNYERNFVGPITLRNAFKDSRNVPAVRLYDQLGASRVIDFANKFGITTDNFDRNDLTLALGSQAVQPLQMATAYAMIANGGQRIEPHLIRRITTLDGVMYEADTPVACDPCEDGVRKAEQVVDPRVTYILGTMMRSVVEEGSGRRVARELPRNDLMGKTGTTNGPAELWFTGFNRDIATSVFVGMDTPEPLGESEQGATVAVPIWIDYMKQALEGTPESMLQRPDGVVSRLINRDTGQLARPGQPNTFFELFLAETAPEGGAAGVPSRHNNRDNEDSLSPEIIF